QLVEEPDPACDSTRGRGPDEILDDLGGERLEGALEHQQIDRFMPQGKSQVVGDIVLGLVAFVEETPGPIVLLAAADMPIRDATGVPHWRLQVQHLHKCGPAGEFGALWDSLV